MKKIADRSSAVCSQSSQKLAAKNVSPTTSPRQGNEATDFKQSICFTSNYWTQIASKRDPEREREAQAWIEEIVGEKFSVPLEDALRDGQVLCHLINKMAPGSVPKINTTGAQFKMMENIQK